MAVVSGNWFNVFNAGVPSRATERNIALRLKTNFNTLVLGSAKMFEMNLFCFVLCNVGVFASDSFIKRHAGEDNFFNNGTVTFRKYVRS